MIATRRRLRLTSVFVVALALITVASPPNTANAANCAMTDLQPTLAQFMVTQGVGDAPQGATSYGYTTLTRGKETAVKLFLVLPSSCTVGNSQYVKIRSASLTVDTGNATNTLITSYTTPQPLPPTAQGNSLADPIFVVPSANLTPLSTGAFAPNFNATITYDRSDGATTQTGQLKPFSATKSFAPLSNALRVYVVPMGDKAQLYNTQYTAVDQTIVQNAMQTLSRIYPTTARVADLTVASGGIRYVVDTATMLDLRSISGAYTTINGVEKFCGTSVNFTAIKGLLAQYLAAHNTANKRNPLAIADRVVGVVGGNTATSTGISFGTENNAGCADGMASVSSPESWIRLVADQTGKPSRSGALAGMEIAHTFGLENTPSYHSGNVQSDGNSDRAYNVSSRSRIEFDHSVMNYNNTGSLWDNTTTLLEAGDFSYLLCKLATVNFGTCSAGKIGSSTGVPAGEKYIIAGTTDGSRANTKVIEPYYDLDEFPTPEDTTSLLRLVQLDRSSTPPTIVGGKTFGVPWSLVPNVSDHDEVNELNPVDTNPATTPIRTFYAAADGFTALGAGEVRLVKVANSADDPRNEVLSSSVTLYSSLKIDPPVITSITGGGIPTSGGTSTLFRRQITPRIPPKPDIVFLADTTGSMTTAISNVRSSISDIISQVKAEQPEAQFAVASYKDQEYCDSDAYMFRIETSMTPTTEDVQSGMDQWSATGGCDEPEAQLNALHRLGKGSESVDGKSVGYREGSSRVVAWFGDAPGHDPSNGHSLQAAIDSLKCGPEGTPSCELGPNSIRVVAVDLGRLNANSPPSDPGNLPGCPSPGCANQATSIAEATGGVVKANNPDQVAQAILDGLHDLPATVTPSYEGYNPDASSDQCVSASGPGPLSVRFTPIEKTVTGGTPVDFTEQVTVAPTAAGTYTCRVFFKINGKIVQKREGDNLIDDPAYFQDISVVVGNQEQKTVTVRSTSTDPDRLLLDLIFECNSFSFVAAIAVLPSAKTATEATFTTNADATNACAKFDGGGKLVPYVSDGWNRTGGTVRTDSSSAPKLPTAAIYTPAIGAAINWDGTLSLRGSGEVAGIELPPSALSWSITSPGGTPTPKGTGDSIDVLAPSPNGWTQGIWTATLTATYESRTATATRTFGAYYQFIGFLSPVENPPLVNKGNTGKTLALKWQLRNAGAPVTSLSTVASTTYAPATACSPSGAVQFAKTSGGSVLKFDQTNMQFVFTWQTPSQVGLYVFRLTLSDGSTHDACVNLSK